MNIKIQLLKNKVLLLVNTAKQSHLIFSYGKLLLLLHLSVVSEPVVVFDNLFQSDGNDCLVGFLNTGNAALAITDLPKTIRTNIN